jgi:hypothetical protein
VRAKHTLCSPIQTPGSSPPLWTAETGRPKSTRLPHVGLSCCCPALPPPTHHHTAGRPTSDKRLRLRLRLKLSAPPHYPRTPAAHRGCHSAKISHHEARASLLGGQPLDRNFNNTAYQPQVPQPGGYHDREGFPTTLPPTVRRAPRMYIPNSRWTWAFMLTAIAQAVIALALESYVDRIFVAPRNPLTSHRAAMSSANSRTASTGLPQTFAARPAPSPPTSPSSCSATCISYGLCGTLCD